MKKNKIVKIFMMIILVLSIQLPIIAATTGVVNVETVRVREEATTKSDIVALVSIGDKITIVGSEEGDDNYKWYEVEVKGEKGYIREDLLTVEGDVPTSVTPNDNNEEEPNENDNHITTEEPDETEEPDNNNEVIPNEGTPNEETPPENNSTVSERNDKTISTLKTVGEVFSGQSMQLAETIKIKILPSANSANIAELNANTQVTVLEVINSWCRVETAEGVCGWIRIDQ